MRCLTLCGGSLCVVHFCGRRREFGRSPVRCLCAVFPRFLFSLPRGALHEECSQQPKTENREPCREPCRRDGREPCRRDGREPCRRDGRAVPATREIRETPGGSLSLGQIILRRALVQEVSFSRGFLGEAACLRSRRMRPKMGRLSDSRRRVSFFVYGGVLRRVNVAHMRSVCRLDS